MSEIIDRDEACTCDWVEYSQHHIQVRVPDPACPVDHVPVYDLERVRDVETHDPNFDDAEIDEMQAHVITLQFNTNEISDEARQSIVNRIYWALDDPFNAHYASGILAVTWPDPDRD